MHFALRRAALAFALLAAPAAAPVAVQAQDAQAQAPQLKKTATHGAWDVICADNGDCSMQQTVNGPAGGPFMLARITRTAPRDTPNGKVESVLEILVPLRVALQGGLGIQIDGGKPQRAPFNYCQPSGCVLQTPMPVAMVASMKKGVNAKVDVIMMPKSPVDVQLSLSGFTKAYNSLKAR